MKLTISIFFPVLTAAAFALSAVSSVVSAQTATPTGADELKAPQLVISGANANVITDASVVGHIYQLLYTDALAAGRWQHVDSVPLSGTGEGLVFDAPMEQAVPQRFFRIAIEPGELVPVGTFGAFPDDGQNDSAAIQAAIESLQPGQVLYFPKGNYRLDSSVWIVDAQQIRLLGESGALLQKTGGYQYMLAFIGSGDVTVEGLSFEGRTMDTEAVAWGEEGLYFGSCTGSTVKNCRFANFGDSAVRITSSLTVGTTDSFDGKILDCYFNNVTQITTTQGMAGAYGGTSEMLIQGNVFDNLKASIKVAGRAPTSGATITGNHVRSSRRDGIQVESVSDAVIADNTLENIARVGVLLNVNDSTPADAAGFPWDRVSVDGNRFLNCASGVQVYLKPYLDGSQFDMEGLEITGNTFDGITDMNTDAVIWIGNTTSKTFVNLIIADNIFSDIGTLQEVRLPR